MVLQGDQTLKGQFGLNLKTLEMDSSPSSLLGKGAKSAFKCNMKDFGHKLPSTSSVKQSKIVISSGLLERLNADHILEKKQQLNIVGIIMNRVSQEDFKEGTVWVESLNLTLIYII